MSMFGAVGSWFSPVFFTAPPHQNPFAPDTTMSDLPGFPALKPALITKVNVDVTKIHPLGVTHRGDRLTHFEVPSGTIETVPGFEPAFRANVVWGGDWFTMDADGKHGRVNFRGIAKTDDGNDISVRVFGIIDMDSPAGKVFNMAPDMATVPFGWATARTEYEVADPKLKFLENCWLVGNARVIVDAQGVSIENRQSIVLPTKVSD